MNRYHNIICNIYIIYTYITVCNSLSKSKYEIYHMLPCSHTVHTYVVETNYGEWYDRWNSYTSNLNSLRPRLNRRPFADDIFKCIFLNENVWISIGISLKFVRKGSINNIPALVLIMAWRRSGDKPLSEPMMFSLLTHICVTRPRWVKQSNISHEPTDIL